MNVPDVLRGVAVATLAALFLRFGGMIGDEVAT